MIFGNDKRKERSKNQTRPKEETFGKSNFSKISVAILTLVFITSLLSGLTLSKYVIEENAPYGNETDIDYTVNSVFVVRSQDELFAAINQGYTYVQLDKEIENPLIVTQKAETLNSDLILDLNGIEIQRNGYDPILNVKGGVRLTIVDTSEEQTGGLYNPVGSVFNVTGGTLTVVTGNFESGPRYSEYYSYNNGVLNNDAGSLTKRTIVENDPQPVKYFKKNESGTSFSEDVSITSAPIIKSYPTKTGEIEYNHGNLYFDEIVAKGDLTVYPDTYCYYRTSEDSAKDATDLSMADWYYVYYVKASDYSYVGATKPSEGLASDYVEITIYGYEDVIKQASNKSNHAEYHAAIQMSDGILDVQKGSFYQYFGVDTTACVNSQGGEIKIKEGNFSVRVPDATVYTQGAISAKESDENAFLTDYFTNFKWSLVSGNGYNDESDNHIGSRAKKGESYCILNGGSASVTVGTGMAYASNSNVIKMHSGVLTINGGNYYKKSVNYAVGENDVSKNDKLSAISIEDGDLKISNATYSVIGEKTAGIYIENGTLTVKDSDFTVEGKSSNGIYSSISTDDGFKIIDTGFVVKGDYATGVYSENGRVNLTATATTPATINVVGNYAYGVHVGTNGSISSENYSYNLSGENSRGIYSEAGTVTFNNGSISLDSNVTCYGVYAVSSQKITIELNSVSVNVGYEDGTATAKNSDTSASVGFFLSSLSSDSTVTLNNCDVKSFELGVVSNGGSVTMNGTGSIQTNMASAIAIRGGSVNFSSGSKYTITSKNTTSTSSSNEYEMTLPVKNSTGVIENVNYVNTDGIYVNGGSFTSEGNLTLTHTGLQNSQSDPDGKTYNYNSLVVTSYAVRVLGGEVKITQADITAIQGGGVYAGKTDVTGTEQVGNIKLGEENVTNKNISVKANGDSVGELYYALGTRNIGDQWQNYKSITGGHAIELNGGNITVYYGTYEAQVGNGVYANGNGNITVYGGTFKGFMNDGKNHTRSGPSSYYGLKVVGGATVNIYDGIFDGGNGGAFVTGVTSLNMYSNTTTINSSQTAHVYIYKGTFGHDTSVDSFNVYDDAIVVFGAGGSEYFKTVKDFQDAIVLYADNASIAANGIAQNDFSNKKSEIYVYYGTYNGACTWLDGYCHSETFYKTYNKQLGYTNATYNMHGDQGNTTAVFYS